MSELNYIDTGFGSKLIDFTQAPFDNVEQKETIDFGFANKSFVTDYPELGEYENNKSLQFGSNKINLSKKIVNYSYEDFFERGTIKVNKNSFGEIKVKNKLISNPVLNCTVFVSGLASDISINTEKVNTRTFRVFNPSSKNIEVNYISSSKNAKKTKITHNQKEIDIKNKNIADYASSYVISIVPKFETIDTKKIDLMNTSGGDYVDTGNLTLDIEHNFVLDTIGTSGAYIIPYVRSEPEESFFSLHMPTIEEVIEITGAAESSIVDTNGALLSDIIIRTNGATVRLYKTDSPDDETELISTYEAPNYLVYLELGTSYYFWYSKNAMGPDNPFGPPGAWLYSTIRFPNVITYN